MIHKRENNDKRLLVYFLGIGLIFAFILNEIAMFWAVNTPNGLELFEQARSHNGSITFIPSILILPLGLIVGGIAYVIYKASKKITRKQF